MADVMAWLNRVFLIAAAGSMRTGRQGLPTASRSSGLSFQRTTGSQATVRTGSSSRDHPYASFHIEEGTMIEESGVRPGGK